MNNPLLDELTEIGAIRHINIALPTLGYFYPANEILNNDIDPNEISIGPLSVLEENVFNDPMMMVSGRGITKMIMKITNAISDPAKLCEIDIQAILIACRIVSHGNMLSVEHTCDKCEKVHPLQIDLEKHLQKFAPFSPEELASFDIKLPSIDHIVRLKPISYEDSIELTLDTINANSAMEKITKNTDSTIISEEFINQYKKQFEHNTKINISALLSSLYFVKTISGKIIHSREYIHEWLLALPATDVAVIQKQIEKVDKFIQDRSKIAYICVECKHKDNIYINLDPQKLFTQAEEPETPKSFSAEQKKPKKTILKPSEQSPNLS